MQTPHFVVFLRCFRLQNEPSALLDVLVKHNLWQVCKVETNLQPPFRDIECDTSCAHWATNLLEDSALLDEAKRDDVSFARLSIGQILAQLMNARGERRILCASPNTII